MSRPHNFRCPQSVAILPRMAKRGSYDHIKSAAEYHGRSLTGGLGYRICLRLYRAALRAVDAHAAVARVLHRVHDTLTIAGHTYDLATVRHLYVIGFGKAAATMARSAEDAFGTAITAGIVVTKYGHHEPTRRIEVLEAAHPIPDEAGIAATQRILALCDAAGADDLVICLVSGGGSALLASPMAGLTLTDEQETTMRLLRAGAPITDLNTVRKHLSAVKGGQLARRVAPAPLITLVLSDVIGDSLEVIASGPTVPDPTTYADALAVLDHYEVRAAVPPAVRGHLEAGAAGQIADTPKGGEAFFAQTVTRVIGNSQLALDAAAHEARAMGLSARVLSSGVEGEAAQAAQFLVSAAIQARRRGQPLHPPCCLLAGGETTVNVRGDGHGGRNSEFALAAALALDGADGIVVASLATDGGDGPTDAAGAIATTHTLARARAKGLDATSFLQRNDAYTFFAHVGGLVCPGPTGTNVNDLMIALVV